VDQYDEYFNTVSLSTSTALPGNDCDFVCDHEREREGYTNGDYLLTS
jgi:hypothetical protein